MATRRASKSVTVGVEDTTLANLSEAATLVGAPDSARISTGAGGVYDPATGATDGTYAYSVTFSWTDEV